MTSNVGGYAFDGDLFIFIHSMAKGATSAVVPIPSSGSYEFPLHSDTAI